MSEASRVQLRVRSEPPNCSAGSLFVARFAGFLTTFQLLGSLDRETGDHTFDLPLAMADEREYQVSVQLWWDAQELHFERELNIPMPGPAHGLGSAVQCSGKDVEGSPFTLHLPAVPLNGSFEASHLQSTLLAVKRGRHSNVGSAPVGRWVSAAGCQILGLCCKPLDPSAFTWVYFGEKAARCTGPSPQDWSAARAALSSFLRFRRLLVVGDSRRCNSFFSRLVQSDRASFCIEVSLGWKSSQ